MTRTCEAVDGFIASLRARRVPANTIKAYAHDLRHFVAAVPTALGEVSASLIQAFLTGDGHLSPATQARQYATLCTFYRWTIRQELMQSNPMCDLPRYLSSEDAIWFKRELDTLW